MSAYIKLVSQARKQQLESSSPRNPHILHLKRLLMHDEIHHCLAEYWSIPHIFCVKLCY